MIRAMVISILATPLVVIVVGCGDAAIQVEQGVVLRITDESGDAVKGILVELEALPYYQIYADRRVFDDSQVSDEDGRVRFYISDFSLCNPNPPYGCPGFGEATRDRISGILRTFRVSSNATENSIGIVIDEGNQAGGSSYLITVESVGQAYRVPSTFQL